MQLLLSDQEAIHQMDHEHFVPYWKRAHKDWRFWVGVVCISVALAVYISTVDLSLVPHRAQQPATHTP